MLTKLQNIANVEHQRHVAVHLDHEKQSGTVIKYSNKTEWKIL